jgi:polar amino acid transport system substrate-binding protein
MWPLVVLLLAGGAPAFGQAVTLAPAGTLRAAFIADNPIQGRVDPQTGVVTGIAADLARELARRARIPYAMLPRPNPSAVIESVTAGNADIGFLAFEAARAEQVDFSEPYVLSESAYLVRTDSTFKSSADVDRGGVRIGTVKGQSQQIFVSAQTKNARVEILPKAPAADAIAAMLQKGEIDAFAGNRQRMEDAARAATGLRVLADSFMVTAQAIVVAKRQDGRLDDINRFLVDVRGSGFLKAAIDRAALGGVRMAPAPGSGER